MSDFLEFKKAVQKKYDEITKAGHSLFTTDVTKDEAYDMYLDSFPAGTNEIFRERREHDCQCCKQFIRATASVVAIRNLKLVSIWDVTVPEPYKTVAKALSNLAKSRAIKDIYYHYENTLGTDYNFDTITEQKWNHFYYKLPAKYVKTSESIPTIQSSSRADKEVLKSGLDEITVEAITTVLELIDQKSLYRGEEKLKHVEAFLGYKMYYDTLETDEDKDNYCWSKSSEIKGSGRIKNSSIGTLLVDISDEVDLNDAVFKYRKIMDPNNYMRSKPVVSKAQIKKAEKRAIELGIVESFPRRYAVIDDITINNVIYADRTVKKTLSVFDEMEKEVVQNVGNLDKVEEVSVEDFVAKILPSATSISLMLENKHENNLMSLISPVDGDSKHMFKWDNNFSWSYNGEVADSMKERVAKAGGDVEGVLRFSIQWNDVDNNQNDFDAHCIEPCGNLISYSGKTNPRTTGRLDVDITQPGSKIAVENITWTDINKMGEGVYKFLVHNFSHNGGHTGFTAEIEYEGKVYSYTYDNELRNSEKVTVAVIKFSRNNGIEFIDSLDSTSNTPTKEVWGVNTNTFTKVLTVMNSPNHWDGNETGNKHLFFMLDGCKNEGVTRGFYNEFLMNELHSDRKVFEVLASKMKVAPSLEQLSGLGFSSTKRNSILCKVEGSFNRIIKINF